MTAIYFAATIYLLARAPREIVVERLTLVGVFRSRVGRIGLSEIVSSASQSASTRVSWSLTVAESVL